MQPAAALSKTPTQDVDHRPSGVIGGLQNSLLYDNLRGSVLQAMSTADAMEGTNGNGVAEAGVDSTDNGEMGQASRRGAGTEVVDARSADRIKQADNAEETRKKDQAFVERYDERVKAVRNYLRSVSDRCTQIRYPRPGTAHVRPCATLSTLVAACLCAACRDVSIC